MKFTRTWSRITLGILLGCAFEVSHSAVNIFNYPPLQRPGAYFSPNPPTTYIQKREAAFLPQQRPVYFPSPSQSKPFFPIYDYATNQQRLRRESFQQFGPIQMRPQDAGDVPRLRRSTPTKYYGKKHPANTGRSCCLNADYCVPWACPPPITTWRKMEPRKLGAEYRAHADSSSGCICNDPHFCPPGCTFDPTNFDRGQVGTNRKVA